MLAFYLSLIDDFEDKIKFEQIYNECSQDMYALAYSILKNSTDAEDAVQETFFKAANNFSKISRISCNKIKAYLVIICKNTSIAIYNKNKKRAEHSAQFFDNLADDIVVEDEFFETVDYELLMDAISELPDKYKDVMYLYHVQDLSASEVSKLMNISAGLVRQRALRAKALLKVRLEELEKSEQIE